MHRLPKPSPALIVSFVALFFALGGSAYAIGSKAFSAQPRCATGAVRGIALITGAKTDISSLSSSNYTSAPSLFGYRWSCSGGAILVRKAAGVLGGVDVKFSGNPSSIAIVSSAASGTPYGGSVSRQPDGSFRVVIGGAVGTPGQFEAQWNVPFVIVLL
ncbi:MAG TPA: hypothetical protein VIE38_14795 [Gaiellaceae bacterium]|jgi:hypothetical protein